mgnify:CR=1 FL=1
MAKVKQKESIKEIEVDGVKVAIPLERLNDIETLEAVTDIQDGNPMAIVPMLRRILGDDYGRIKNELKGDAETLSIDRMAEWFTAVMEALGTKN